MQILRPALLLLQHPRVATFHGFSCSSRPLLSFMASASSPSWLPAQARRVSPLMVFPYPPARRVSRSPEPLNMATILGVKDNQSVRPYIGASISSANSITISQDKRHSGIINIDTRDIISEFIAGAERSDKDACRVTSEDIYIIRDTLGEIVKHTECGNVDHRKAMYDQRGGIVVSDEEEISDNEKYTTNKILEESRHRDGSIYRNMDTWWKNEYCISDHNETRLEAMAFSNPTNCIIRNGSCTEHYPCRMLQILSIKLAKTPADCGLIELYGYIAVRDDLDPLLNYVVKFSRDAPIIIEQGSLINMTGPKRGIEMIDLTLIEYDMRIKTGKEEKYDLQLIDGASLIGPAGIWNRPFTIHIPGDYGAVDITLSRLHSAVEATVEILISEVQSSFDLSLSCFTSSLNKRIWLFNGAIPESCGLKRSVVVVLEDNLIDLRFKIGAVSSSCSFEAKIHGHDTQEIKTALACILVKVTWSTLPSGLD